MAFDSQRIIDLGWRQGAILAEPLSRAAVAHAVSGATPTSDADCLILTSHDCDITNGSLEKEPVVELLHGRRALDERSNSQLIGGRNPRRLQLEVPGEDGQFVISCAVHDRWSVPRELLLREPPRAFLPDRDRRLVAEWLAKRYVRSAFPTAFDLRWRRKQKAWLAILNENSEWIQGVYLRLSTLDELPPESTYRVRLILAVPHAKRTNSGWPTVREKIETAAEDFWSGVHPAVECEEVDVLGTDEITLSAIERYQRFDADWVSFADETPATPLVTDLHK